MSTSHFIHCESCHDTLGFAAESYEIPVLLTIIRHARAIVELAPLIEASGGSLSLGDGDRRNIYCRWFEKHLDHPEHLVVMDEYNRIDGRCGEHYTCDRCQSSHFCNRSKDHPPSEQHAGRI